MATIKEIAARASVSIAFREESGYRLGKEILIRQHRPTALFVCNGVMTLGVLQALDETGVRYPQDLAIATFDDLSFGRAFHPRLTCIAQATYELGFKGATLLIDRIEGKHSGGPAEIQLASELRIRESTTGRDSRPVYFDASGEAAPDTEASIREAYSFVKSKISDCKF
jgi:DNA-binding LacI/PurR family transcriptional regulator